MVQFEVLGATLVDYDEVIFKKLEQPLLYVDVSYEKHVIFFIYHLNTQQQWTFQEFKLANGVITNQERNHAPYHDILMNLKRKDGTFTTFVQEMNKIESTLLNHPIVRIKAVLFK